MANKNLNAAKTAKKDEFYTQLTDIERELQHYWQHFRDKVVLCNCDDPYESNFFKYFALRFNQLGLKKLICTCYNGSPVQGNELMIDFGDFTAEPKDVQYLLKNDKNVISTLKTGDFRDPECIELLKQADIVVTNPPFSLFREYIGQLMEYEKKFLVIGMQANIIYKDIFPLVINNKIWLGYGFKGGAAHFVSPYEDTATASDHKEGMIRVSGVHWFTNLEIPKRNAPIDLVCRYSPEEYPMLDNYDAINVNSSNDIPCNYWGMMAVPITFLDKYSPEQFEIVGITRAWDGKASKIYPEQIQIDKNGKRSKVTKLNDGPALLISNPPSDKTYYEVGGNYYLSLFQRILIRNKHPQKI